MAPGRAPSCEPNSGSTGGVHVEMDDVGRRLGERSVPVLGEHGIERGERLVV
ncbi:hypothetical protein [Sorangium sp. So ce1000]|uniref:hypothetical protein n=1 Tax=Sorangium sp. So ce1000 TaxID=3133325 RepID=UPI003F5FC13E